MAPPPHTLLVPSMQRVIVLLSRFMIGVSKKKLFIIGYSVKVHNIFVYLLNHQSRISDITSTTSRSGRIELMVMIKPSLRSWKMFPVNPLVNPSFSKKF